MLWTQRMERVRERERDREVKVKLRNTANAFSGYGGSDLLGKIEISKPKYYCFYFFFYLRGKSRRRQIPGNGGSPLDFFVFDSSLLKRRHKQNETNDEGFRKVPT